MLIDFNFSIKDLLVFVFRFLLFGLNITLRNGRETHIRFAGIMWSLLLNRTPIFDWCVVRWASMISSTRLGLEFMPFGQVPTGQAMTHHGGMGFPYAYRIMGQGPHSDTPGNLAKFFIFWILTNSCCPPHPLPGKHTTLAFSKAACPQTPHWVHFTLKTHISISMSHSLQ